jgi:hypothetical protein
VPSATKDVGNWLEPLGLASLFIEGILVAVTAYILGVRGWLPFAAKAPYLLGAEAARACVMCTP